MAVYKLGIYMKILSLESCNNHTNLKINKINFDRFSLLVGASGVGKTQILRSIMNLKNIASGQAISGFSWNVNFDILGDTYNWKGEFEKNSAYSEGMFPFFFGGFSNDKETRAKIIFEQLTKNDKLVIERRGEVILFNEQLTVKLSPTESVINLLRAEEEIEIIANSFSKIDYINPDSQTGYRLTIDDVDADEVKTLAGIRNSNISILSKLYLCQEYEKDFFDEMIETYKDIFPFIEDIKIQMHQPELGKTTTHKIFYARFKEKGVESWIEQNAMSSGMSKTLTQLAYLHLSSDGAVLLIDEFENGFGVNCINDITDELMNSSSIYKTDIQFIMTSHHPYIINNIPIDYWKIISRKAGIVKSYNAKDFNLHDSNHEAFTKLINLSVYADGANR